ncbi:MAG: IPT/TIG domain-containing protein, partial [Betaproteobacteria bacterium]
GSTGVVTVETRGLPRRFTAAAIYSRDLDGITSDQAPASAIEPRSPLALKVSKTTWPAQSWCIIYNQSSPDLIAAVKAVLGIAGNPTQAQIRSVIIDKVGGSAKKAQATYENDGHLGPNLVINQTCGGGVSRYNIHMVTQGSSFRADDPGEAVSSDATHFGRLFISNGRVDDALNTDLGSSLASVAHEMHHAVQSASRISTGTMKGYIEGAATIYGKAIDNSGALKVRRETEVLGRSLMTPDPAFKYGNEDFFTYVARQYNMDSLNYLSGLYAQMGTAINGANNPAPAVGYGAMDAHFKAAFPGQSLQTIYLDFLKQRLLTHNASSQFGRAGETVSGFAPALLAGALANETVDVTTCGAQKITRVYPGVESFAARAIVIGATGAVPAASPGPTLVVRITPATSTIGALWNGFTFRANAAAAVAASNKFVGFGKQAGDQVVIVMANLDPANAGGFTYEISCGGLNIDSISPTKGAVDTLVTINGTGFGIATDTRAVYFNGLKATTATFVSDTQATAKVPANASSGDVVVEVNGQKSNGIPFEVIAQCSNTQNAGGDTPDTRTIELGKPSGTFNFMYETYAQEDQIIVRYQGVTLFDTGCVGANGTQALTYNGTSTSITVQVIPNCKGGSGTAWNYSVSCP